MASRPPFFLSDIVIYLARRANARRVIDVGSGLASAWPLLASEFEVIGIGKPRIASMPPNGTDVTVLPSDLKKSFPDISSALLDDSIVVCTNLMQSLGEPEVIGGWLADVVDKTKYTLISTPDRFKVHGPLDSGPPANSAHTMEWTIDEFCRFLIDCGFSRKFMAGYTANNREQGNKDTVLILAGREAAFRSLDKPITVAAIIHVFNEADVILHVVRHLHQQGVEVHVVDNWSSDGSYELACHLQSQGLCKNVLRFPDQPSADYEWEQQLRYTSDYGASINAEWIIHHDADEIRQSPWKNVTLSEAITFVDSLGYNAIDFTVINFPFIQEVLEHHKFSPDNCNFFDFGRHEADFVQVKAWRNRGMPVDLWSSGGHEALFEGRKIYPLKFLIKHYPLRSAEQANRKIFQERVPRSANEHTKKGWHTHYDFYKKLGSIRPWRRQELKPFDEVNFQTDYFVERLTGVGIEQDPTPLPSLSSMIAGLAASEETSRRVQVLLAKYDRTCAKLRDERTRRREADDEKRRALENLKALKKSRSWRLTARLRRFTRLFGKRTI